MDILESLFLLTAILDENLYRTPTLTIMDRDIPNNLNKFLLDRDKSIRIHEPNINLDSYFGEITPVFRNIESFLVDKIRKYPAVVGSVYNIGSKPIAYALSDCEKVFLITQNANFHPKYFSKKVWENSLGWQVHPFQTSLKTIFNSTSSRWYVEALGITNTLNEKLRDMLAEWSSHEKLEELEENTIQIDCSLREKLERSLIGQKIIEALDQYNIGVLLPPIYELFHQSSTKFPDFTEFAKYISIYIPICIPGERTLVYANEAIGSSLSALMHHKFIVFLDRAENLFTPKRNLTVCPGCGYSLEEPDSKFWEDIYQEEIANGEEPEDAEFYSEETVIPCPYGLCSEQHTFYNPKFSNKFRDPWPDYNPRYEPVAVWTGSFNFTYSAANRHLENGVFIKSSNIAKIYFHEWAMNFLIAEKLKL